MLFNIRLKKKENGDIDTKDTNDTILVFTFLSILADTKRHSRKS